MPVNARALVDLAFNAALNDALWADWTLAAMQAFGAVAANLFVLRRGDDPIERMHTVWPSARVVEDYFGEMWHHDPLVEPVNAANRNSLLTNQERVGERHDGSPYSRWYREVVGAGGNLVLVTKVTGERRAGATIHLAANGGPMSKSDRASLLNGVPSLHRAFTLAFQHQQLLLENFWDGLTALRSAEAVVLLDEDGRAIRATQSAVALFERADGIRLTCDRLAAMVAEDDRCVAALVARATARDGLSGAVRVQRPSGRQPLVLVAYPLPRAHRVLAPFEAAALLTITDPGQRNESDPTLLRQAFGLTPREAELARLLVAHHSVESAAAVMGTAVPTARLHLHRLLDKTVTSRQSHLIGLLKQVT